MVRLPRRSIPLFAKDIMSSPVLTIGEKEPLRKAATMMCENKVGSIVVVGSDGKIRGIVTERDVTCAARRGTEVCDMPVWEFMTPDPVVVRPTTPVGEVLEKFSELGIRHLPVVDEENKPVGIISVRDILALMELLFKAFK